MCRKYPVILETLGIGMPKLPSIPARAKGKELSGESLQEFKKGVRSEADAFSIIFLFDKTHGKCHDLRPE